MITAKYPDYEEESVKRVAVEEVDASVFDASEKTENIEQYASRV